MKEKYGEHTVDTYRAEIQYFLGMEIVTLYIHRKIYGLWC